MDWDEMAANWLLSDVAILPTIEPPPNPETEMRMWALRYFVCFLLWLMKISMKMIPPRTSIIIMVGAVAVALCGCTILLWLWMAWRRRRRIFVWLVCAGGQQRPDDVEGEFWRGAQEKSIFRLSGVRIVGQ